MYILFFGKFLLLLYPTGPYWSIRQVLPWPDHFFAKKKNTKMPFFAVIKDNLAHDLFKFCYIYTFSRVAIEISQILEELTKSLKKVY